MKKNIPSENKKTHKTINPIGRPTKYNNELADKIVDIIATSNRSIASICKEFGLSPSTIYDWIENNKDFSDKYARAKEWQADYMAEEIIEISDNATNDYMTITKGDQQYEAENKEFVSRSRLRVDSRKWLASKLKPKKYSDTVKTEISNPDGSLNNLSTLTTDQLLERLEIVRAIEQSNKRE